VSSIAPDSKTVQGPSVAVHYVELSVFGHGGVHEVADVFLVGDVTMDVAGSFAQLAG